jgi:hypothetical protein
LQRGHLFVEIIRAGVGVFFYLDDRERKPDAAVGKMMRSLTILLTEVERDQARQRLVLPCCGLRTNPSSLPRDHVTGR